MTKEEAIAKAESGWWKTATPREIVAFQLYEDLLCMDFVDFQGAVEAVLGRPVWTHEFGTVGREHLIAEFEGRAEPATVAESMQLLADLAGNRPVIAVIAEEPKP